MVCHYPQFRLSAVRLGTYHPQIQGKTVLYRLMQTEERKRPIDKLINHSTNQQKGQSLTQLTVEKKEKATAPRAASVMIAAVTLVLAH